MAVATSHEKSWRLSTSAKAWSVDKSKEIRNMLRHVAAGVRRSDWGNNSGSITEPTITELRSGPASGLGAQHQATPQN